MSGMPIFIHTSGRPYDQKTFSWFGDDLRRRTYFVVQEREADIWYDQAAKGRDVGKGILILPPEIKTLSPTRQWILEHAAASGMDKIVMLDDDLRFSYRSPGYGIKLFHSDKSEVTNMFAWLERLLDNVVHAGVSAREGNNHVETDTKDVTRMMRVLAYRPKAVLATGARFDRIRTKQDFDMTLQLLKLGFPNTVLYNFAQDQSGSAAPGGCAAYRTPGMMAEDAQHLADLHPDFVTVVRKETKKAWGGGERVDVRIAWQKAFESAGVSLAGTKYQGDEA